METQRKYFIGGNWKSNGTLSSIRELIDGTLKKLDFNTDRVRMFTFPIHHILEVVVAPVSIHLTTVQEALKDTKVEVAAQNSSATL